MATDGKTTVVPQDLEVVPKDLDVKDEKPKPTSDVTRLITFFPNLTVVEEIERTARYAANPEAYLRDILGTDVFETRKHLLSIPDKVDRDTYGSGAHKEHFESHIAALLGKKHGIYFTTGVQAQLATLKTYCTMAKNNRVAWHGTAHLEGAELKSFREVYGLERTLLGNDDDQLATVAEIEAVLSLPAEQRPAAILIEIPNRSIGCQTYTFAELEQISAACRAAGVKFHMDGARLWEIEPYYQASAGKTFADLGRLFDSVYVSFYKGLGGAAGAMLVTDDEAVFEDAKLWQRRVGGNVITSYFDILDCERGYNTNIGTFAGKRQKALDIAAAVLDLTAEFRNADGERIVRFVPEMPLCCNSHTLFSGFTREQLEAARDRVREKDGVQLFDWLHGKGSLDDMIEERRAKRMGKPFDDAKPADDRRHPIEWWISNDAEKLDTKIWADGYASFCRELLAGG